MKERYDYSKINLTKAEGVTTFNGKTVSDLGEDAKTHLMNYGLFVKLTRTLAGHEKDNDSDKLKLVQHEWDWLMAGCPKRQKAVETAEQKAARIKEETIKVMRAAVANGSKQEKKMVEDIIAKM